MCAWRPATSASRAAVASVDPSTTKMSRLPAAGMLWSTGERRHGSTCSPGWRPPTPLERAHRRRPEVSTATRWPSAVIAATGTSAISSARVALRSPADGVDDRGGERQQRRLDGHEGAVERQVRQRAPRPPQPARPRGGDRRGVRRALEAGLDARHDRQVRLRLDEQHEDTDDEAQRRPAVERVPAAGGAHAQRRGQRRVGDVVGDAVQVDADGRRLAAPARDLAVAAVEQQLQLDEGDGADGAEDPRQRQAGGRQQPAGDHQPGHAVGSDRRAQQQPRHVRRQAPHVEPARPVLGVGPLHRGGRLGDRPQLSDRRHRRTRPPARGSPRRRGRGARGSCSAPGAWRARARPRRRTGPR